MKDDEKVIEKSIHTLCKSGDCLRLLTQLLKVNSNLKHIFKLFHFADLIAC